MSNRYEMTPEKQAMLDRIRRISDEINAGNHELLNELKVAKARYDAGQITLQDVEQVVADTKRRNAEAIASRRRPLTPRGQQLVDAWSEIVAKRDAPKNAE